MFAEALLATIIVAQQSSPRAAHCGTQPGIYTVAVPGSPMSAVPTPDEQTVLVSLNSSTPTQPNGIAILKCVGGRYQYVRTLTLEDEPAISALTHDGKLLIVPDDNFIAFVSVEKAVQGAANPIVGYIEEGPSGDGGAVYAAVSSDDRYAFIAEEQTAELTVVDLRAIRKGSINRSAIVSEFPIGNAPVALVPSADKNYLFATVQTALRRYNYPHTCKPEMTDPSAVTGTEDEPPGAVVTIDIAKAISDPKNAILSNVRAGCHPVRAALSPDGAMLWVTARKDNALYGFATARLVEGRADALEITVPVGPAPVPVIATPEGKYVLVGNSNRFGGSSQNQVLEVIDTSSHEIRGQIPVGAFPRQLNMTESGSAIILSNYGSNSLTIIDPAAIPSAMTPAFGTPRPQ